MIVFFTLGCDVGIFGFFKKHPSDLLLVPSHLDFGFVIFLVSFKISFIAAAELTMVE